MTIQSASVVIASYRRSEMLRETILSMTKMEIPSELTVETVVIDNDPDGSSRAVVEALTKVCEPYFELRYVHEPTKGLSVARNRGIEESRGDVIVFLDDDVFVAANWLTEYIDCFRRTAADCVGGRTLIHWEDEPDPVLRECESRLVAVDFGDEDFELRGKKLPGGGNAAFRRDVFAHGLRFSTELGRIGDILLSGEDTELMARLRRDGGRIWYAAKAVMHHRTGGARLTRDYMVKQKYWFGISFAVIDRRLYGSASQWMRAAARAGKATLVDLPKLLWAKLQQNPAGTLVARCALAKHYGYLRATFAGVPLKTSALVTKPS